jgi:glycosyltransferase involved in cell wall biosynthesis
MVNPGISACMMVKNEEKNLSELLPNLKGVVDEIVAIDHESTDRTVSMLKKEGAKIIPMPDPFREKTIKDSERQILNDNASHEWILHIDADERLTDGTRIQLPTFARQNDYDAIWLISKHFYAPGKWFKHGYYRPHHEPRFYRKSCKTNWNMKIHEPPIILGRHMNSDLEYNHLYYVYEKEHMWEKHEVYVKVEREQKGKYLSKNRIVRQSLILLGYPVYLLNGLIKYKAFLDGWEGIKTNDFLARYYARSGYLELFLKKRFGLIKYNPCLEE